MAGRAPWAGSLAAPWPPECTAEAVVLWAVRSLYVDEALPRARLLQWLLQVLAGVKLCHRDLRRLVDAAPGVRAEPPSAAKLNFCAVLESPPPGFAGFASEECHAEVGPETREELVRCLAGAGWPPAGDRSHKYYVVASWLQDVSAHLRGLSFGRVLSLVRYCSQNDMLGHRMGMLVPYAQSEEHERKANACSGQPTHVFLGENFVKTWDSLRACLRELFQQQKEDTLDVAKMKAMFRTSFKMELSETVFGYQNLSRLFSDQNIQDEFALEIVPSNRFMLRVRSAPRQTVCLAEAIGMESCLDEDEGEDEDSAEDAF